MEKNINLVHICILCNQQINTPCKTSKCDHVFCCDCISQWLRENNCCPYKCSAIRQEDFFFISKKELKQANAPFKCPRYNLGCKNILMKSDLDYHLINECEFRNIGLDRYYIKKDYLSETENRNISKSFPSNCFLELSPLSTLSKAPLLHVKKNSNQYEDIKTIDHNRCSFFNINNTTHHENNQNKQNNELNDSSFTSNLLFQNIPDESEANAEFFSSIQHLSIEQIQIAEISKTIMFLSDQFRKFLQHYIYSVKSKSTSIQPYESILEKQDLYFQQMEQKVDQIKKGFSNKEKDSQSQQNRYTSHFKDRDSQIVSKNDCSNISKNDFSNVSKNDYSNLSKKDLSLFQRKISENLVLQDSKNQITSNQNNLKERTNSNQTRKKLSEISKTSLQNIKSNNKINHINNENNQFTHNISNNSSKNNQIINKNTQTNSKFNQIKIQEENQKVKNAKKVNISLISNQENNQNLMNQYNERKNTSISNRQNTDTSSSSFTSIKLNTLFQNETQTGNNILSSSQFKCLPNQSFQSKKNSSYCDLKKVQKVSQERKDVQQSGNACNLNTRYSLQTHRKSTSREKLRLHTNEQQSENTIISSPNNDFCKTGQTQQTSRSSIANILSLPLQFYSDQSEALTTNKIQDFQQNGEQFTSRFEKHGISAQSGEDCKNLDIEEFSSQKIQTKNFSFNRNQLDTKEQDLSQFNFKDQFQLHNQQSENNELLQIFQKCGGHQTSQYSQIVDENANDVTQIDTQNTNTTIHFFKACKSTLNNSLDLKQSYNAILSPKCEKQIISTILNDPKYQSKFKFQIKSYNNLILIIKAVKENDIRYIVNVKWWRSWTQYVSFYEKDSNADNQENNNIFEKRLSVNYERPAYINNRILTKDYEQFDDYQKQSSNLLRLNENLLEHHDYVILSKGVFMQLKKWYNVDVIIPRFVKFDSFERIFFVDLYPEKSYQTKNCSRSNSNNDGKCKKNGDQKISQHTSSRTNKNNLQNEPLVSQSQIIEQYSKDKYENNQLNNIKNGKNIQRKGINHQDNFYNQNDKQRESMNEDANKQCSIF